MEDKTVSKAVASKRVAQKKWFDMINYTARVNKVSTDN